MHLEPRLFAHMSSRHSMYLSTHDFTSIHSNVLPVLKVDRFSCVDYDMHKIPTAQGWPSQRLVTKCLMRSSCGFASFGRGQVRVKVRLFSHRLWIWWHFSQFQHCLIPKAHYCYWLVMVTPVAVSNNCFLWFRPLDMCAILATGIDHSQPESILVACDLFPLNIDSMWDTKCTKHLS